VATLLTLRDEARTAAGVDAADPLHSDTNLTRDINASLAKIATLGDPWWLHAERTAALVADQAEYALAADVTRVRWVLLEEAKRTEALSAYRRQEMDSFQDMAAGRPWGYSADGAVVRVGPKPASSILPATLRIGVVIAEPRLVNTTDVPKLPDHYTDAIVTAAGYRAAIRSQNAEMAALLRGERDEWFLVIKDNMRRHLAAPRMQVRREWS
jgi:hypothetical protein